MFSLLRDAVFISAMIGVVFVVAGVVDVHAVHYKEESSPCSSFFQQMLNKDA